MRSLLRAAQQLAERLPELKAMTAELAASLAEERLKSKLTPTDQDVLIDKSIDRLKTLHEESDPR